MEQTHEQEQQDHPFLAFTRNGMTSRVNDLSLEYANVLKAFAIGMGTFAGVTEIAAVHKNSFSGFIGKARARSFLGVLEAMKELRGENANVRYAWYLGPLTNKADIAQVLSRGFTSFHGYQFGKIELIPMNVVLDGALALAVGVDGLRHMLLCRVILGKMEVVADGSNQFGPSSDEFDSGVDSVVNCRKHFVWSHFMNSHIVPAYVVSFKGPESFKVCATTSTNAASDGSAITEINREPPPAFVALAAALRRFLSPTEMKIMVRLLGDYRAKRISFEELKRKARLIAGDKLDSVIKLISPSFNMENGSARIRDISVLGLINVLAVLLAPSKIAMLMKSLKEFRANKMNIQELARSVRTIVGDNKVLVSAIRSYRIGKQQQRC